MLSDEERKAIETIKNFIKYYKKNEQTGNRANLDVLGEEIEAIKTVLNLINKQEKAIDRMAEYIETICGCSETARDLLYENNYEIYLEKPSKFSKEKIKEYFMEDKENE